MIIIIWLDFNGKSASDSVEGEWGVVDGVAEEG